MHTYPIISDINTQQLWNSRWHEMILSIRVTGSFTLRPLCRKKINGEFPFEALRCSTDLSSRPGRAPETHSDALAVDLLAGHGIVAEVWLECGLSTKSGATAVAT